MSRITTDDVTLFRIVNDPVPLRIDEGGAIRIGQTRVTLDTIVAAFNQGVSADKIVDIFPGLVLADVYAVISYYLRRREEIDAYLQKQQEFAEEFRRQHSEMFDTAGLRERLLARRLERETAKNAETTC